jgi:hypothetical protein
MRESRSVHPAVAVGVLVVLAAIIIFVFWRGMGPSTPRPRPGQTLENPFGPGGPPAPQQAPR